MTTKPHVLITGAAGLVGGILRQHWGDRLYFVHNVDDDTPIDETLRALDHLVQQGKILYP